MITISQDAEFMVNLTSANPIPAGNRFFAFSDENLNPAVLSHSQDNKLNLVLETDGIAQLYDLGAICSLSGDLQAFAALQDDDLNVWIAAATDSGDGQSNFYFIINLQPSALLDPPTDNIIQEASDTLIRGMYMSNFTRNVKGLKFPLAFVAFQPLDRITKEDQLGFITVSVDSNQKVSLSFDKTWSLATNTLKILDVTFGTCRLGNGAFALYETSGDNGATELKLQFRVFEGRNFCVELKAPLGAACLAAYSSSNSSTSFLVGGNNIQQYIYSDYNKKSGTGTSIVGDSNSTLGITTIHNTQNDTNLTVWNTTSAEDAWYYSATTSNMSNGLLVQLLPEKSVGQMSGMLSLKTDEEADSSTLINTLLSVGEEGELTILQQASDTTMWSSHPFYIPSATNNMEIPTYTLRIKAHTDSVDPSEKVANSQLYISASGLVRMKCNGKTSTLDQTGTWVQADHSGTATILITVADMSCYTVRVEKFAAQGSIEIALSDIPLLVPTSKVINKLKSIQTGHHLLNAKTQSGTNLIDSGTVSQGDADAAASIIKGLTNKHDSLTQQTSTDTQARLRAKASALKKATMVRASADSATSPWEPQFSSRICAALLLSFS